MSKLYRLVFRNPDGATDGLGTLVIEWQARDADTALSDARAWLKSCGCGAFRCELLEPVSP